MIAIPFFILLRIPFEWIRSYAMRDKAVRAIIQAPRSVAITVQNDQAFTATPRMLAALAVRLARRRLLLSGAGRLPFAFWRAGRPLPLIRLKPRAAAAVPVGLLTKSGPRSTEHKAAQQHRSAHCLKSIRHVHPVLKSCVLSSWPKAKKPGAAEHPQVFQRLPVFRVHETLAVSAIAWSRPGRCIAARKRLGGRFIDRIPDRLVLVAQRG
jgi:hypothetical protein